MKLLIVEDNQKLAHRMQEKLAARYTIDRVESGEEGLERANNGEYAAIILDLGLPGISGLETCTRIRGNGNETPILILTGDGRAKTCVTLLDGGADDYMTKPFNSEELRARVGALARRTGRAVTGQVMTVADMAIDTARREVSRTGIILTLRRKEFDILEYLAANKGRIVTRQMILDNVWRGDTRSWSTTVDVHIKNLRDKIDRPFAHPLIHTVYGLGYKVEDPKD